MTKKPKEKKSEGLDVRLPYSVKKRFMAATKARGETASAAVRRFIEEYIAETEAALSKPPLKEVAMTAQRNPLKTLAIAGTALGAMSLAALPSAADEAVFKVFDKNSDGVVTYGEGGDKFDEVISVLDTDRSGGLSLTEFKLSGDGIDVQRPRSDSDTPIIVRRVVFEISEDGEQLNTMIFEAHVPDQEIEGGETEDDRVALVVKNMREMDVEKHLPNPWPHPEQSESSAD